MERNPQLELRFPGRDELLRRRAPAQRALLGACLAAVVLAAWSWSASPLGAALRAGPVRLALVGPRGAWLWRYDPSTRDLRGVFGPAEAALDEKSRPDPLACVLRAAGAQPTLRLSLDPGLTAPWPEGGRLAEALRTRPGHLLAADGWVRRGELSWGDAALLALEASGLPDRERPVAVVPLREAGAKRVFDEALAARLRARFFAPEKAAEGRRAVAEVLNATQRDGLALKATKSLRLQGVDVINYGSFETPLERTLVLDRHGDGWSAKAARAALGVAAPVLTELTPWTRAEATVLLGADYP